MKYRFIIVNTFEGLVQGTNDESVAHDYSLSEDHYVVDVQTGRWLAADGETDIRAC